MPLALDRLLTCPAALRRLLLQSCRSATSQRGYSSDALPELHQDAAKKGHHIPARPAAFRAQKLGREYNLDSPELARPGQSKDDQKALLGQAALWAESLLYHERIDGLNGIRDVFFSMQRRGFRLPTEDTPDAGIIWATLLKHPQLVMRVLDSAAHTRESTGKLYPHLYEKCMLHWLPRDVQVALDAHHRMVVKLKLRRLPLRRLAQVTKTALSRYDRTLFAFMDIYRTSNERNLYDDIVPMLCDQGKITLARRWHTMCIHRKDLPSAGAASHPVVQLFQAEASTISAPDAAGLIASDGGTTVKRIRINETRKGMQKYNQELMRRLTGRDRAPVRFDDTFCARLFATKAFPPASIIRGLVMAGVNQIGPQALRHMGLRTDPISELPQRFRELKEAGIDVQPGVFSLALEKFAEEGRYPLVHSILESDQHPEVFDDAEVQKKLLAFYLEQDDWKQAHRTLAILALFHNDASTESWNIMLQARVKQFNPHQLIRVLQDMRTHGVMVSDESMAVLRTVLPRRIRRRRPDVSTPNKVDTTRFLARCYMMILESGIGMVYPAAWKEIIRRLGMLGRLRELRRLLFWLLFWYARRGSDTFAKLPKPPSLDAARVKMVQAYPERYRYLSLHVKRLFPKSLQQGIIVWGFRAFIPGNAPLEQSLLSTTAAKRHYRRRFLKKGLLRQEDWSIGLRTLVELRDHGVPVRKATVIKVLQRQFAILFGRRRELVRAYRTMKRANSKTLREYVREANEIWGSPLFREPEPGVGYRVVVDGGLDVDDAAESNDAPSSAETLHSDGPQPSVPTYEESSETVSESSLLQSSTSESGQSMPTSTQSSLDEHEQCLR